MDTFTRIEYKIFVLCFCSLYVICHLGFQGLAMSYHIMQLNLKKPQLHKELEHYYIIYLHNYEASIHTSIEFKNSISSVRIIQHLTRNDMSDRKNEMGGA
jgi:hypothetical protein